MTKAQEELLDLQVYSLLDPKAEDGNLARKVWRLSLGVRVSRCFAETEWGFDLVVMNPPWEAVKPEDDDFFSVLHPGFRRIKSKTEKRTVMEKLLKTRRQKPLTRITVRD